MILDSRAKQIIRFSLEDRKRILSHRIEVLKDAATEEETEALYSQIVEDCRIEIVDINRLLGRLK
jgi:hypothetical protein